MRRLSQPPSVRSLFTWTIPFVAIAALVDWLLYHDMASHRAKYGHWYFPFLGIITAAFVTLSAILALIAWCQMWRKGTK